MGAYPSIVLKSRRWRHGAGQAADPARPSVDGEPHALADTQLLNLVAAADHDRIHDRLGRCHREKAIVERYRQRMAHG